MRRWLLRTLAALTALAVLTYLGDWAVYQLRGSPTSTIQVNRLLTVPLKGGKQEIDDQGPLPVNCSRSLFPQGGMQPCWQLRRHPEQITTL